MHIVSNVKHKEKFKMRNKLPLRMEGLQPEVIVRNVPPKFSGWGKRYKQQGTILRGLTKLKRHMKQVI